MKSQYSKYGEHFETVRECIQRQKIDIMINKCMCIPWYYANRMFSLGKYDLLDKAVRNITETQNEEGAAESATESSDGNRKRRSAPRAFKIMELLNVRSRERRDTPTEESVVAPTEEKVAPTEGKVAPTEGKVAPTEEKVAPTEEKVAPTEGKMTPTEGTSAPTMDPVSVSNYTDYVCSFVLQETCDTLLELFLKDDEINFQMDECPEPCAYREWDVEMASTVFPPTEKYFDKFIKDTFYIFPTPNFSYARENLGRIHIYYDDIKMNNFEQEKAYEPQNFVAEFGGTVDLFIGFSFFTVFQLIEIAVAFILFKCCNKKNNHDYPSINEAGLEEAHLKAQNVDAAIIISNLAV